MRIPLTVAAIVAAIFAAYSNSLEAPFVFDDKAAIVENPTIRRLWPLTDVLTPQRGQGLTVEGRPVLNLTFALNYAVGGTSVRGYHLFNIAVHALAALTFFGLVRRTLLLPRLRERFGTAALPLAALIALLWALHPLQTESVTYVVQRAEAMVALFYLLTLYGFVRCTGLSGRSALRWKIFAFVACLIGMATKEVMVSAPLLVLLFDAAFVTGTLREALRQRGRLHAAFFSTWLLLAALVLSTGTRGGTAGFGINVTPWTYALTQFEAITRYIMLSFWPHPLIFDYGVRWAAGAGDVLPYALFVLTLFIATLFAWRRQTESAFFGLLFFAVLSPTSSIVPGNRQTISEHRMYLPLAAIIALAVCVAYLAVHGRSGARRLFFVGIVASIGLGALTWRRNLDYRTEIILYHDTAAKRPGNGFAHYNLGHAYADVGRHADALRHFRAAIAGDARFAPPHNSLANSLAALGQRAEAMAEFRAALKIDPNYAAARSNYANLLLQDGRVDDAIAEYREALRRQPGLFEARMNLANALYLAGRGQEALDELGRVMATRPAHADAYDNAGKMHLRAGRTAEAIRLYERAVELASDNAAYRANLGYALAVAGRMAEAAKQLEHAVRLNPNHLDARVNLGGVRYQAGDLRGASEQFEAALRIDPNSPEARKNLEVIRQQGAGAKSALPR